ncbi:MAG: cation:dicarboxylase symporter family transporter, partial [Acidobacteriota bacterium]
MKKLSLTSWIMIGLVAGVVFGTLLPGPAKQVGVLGAIFLRLIKSIIAPLIFATLVSGIASTGSIKTMGRIGGKALIYFEVVTTVALFVGLAAVNLAQPGAGVALPRDLTAPAATAGPGLAEILEHTFPTSIVDAMARGEVLQIVVFSLLFGMACATIGARAKPVLDLCDSLAGVMFRFTDYIMWFAPIGVFGAIASTIGERGLRVLLSLGKLVATLWAAEAFFVVAVLGAVVAITGIPLRRFIKATRAPFLIAFSTASSEAALPKALENLERFGVPKHIAAFVLPAGYSFNLDGSTLYLALASVFIAQAAGIHLSLGTQILMLLTLMLTSKGVAGVPRASLVVLAATASSFGLP